MPNTVPNQRTVRVHRERATSDFLGIKNVNWQAAARDLGAHALMLYLYFAANRDNYLLALSPTAIEAAIGMPRSTYRDQFVKLLNRGYLVEAGGNVYDFYEAPQHATRQNNNELSAAQEKPQAVQDSAQIVQNKTGEDIEININNLNTINSGNGKQVSHSSNKFDF